MNQSIIASNPENSCWVFASAGSGKTKILVDRILRLLLADISPSKILCLTFTKVAAAEMEERINNRLAWLVLLNDEELRLFLQNLTGKSPNNELLKKARIIFVKTIDAESRIKVQTIHSFCQGLMKIFPFEAGIKPAFEVMEESAEKLMLEQALKETIVDDKNSEMIKAISAKIDEGSLADLLSALLAKKEKMSFDAKEVFDLFKVPFDENEQDIFSPLSPWDTETRHELRPALRESSSSMSKRHVGIFIKFFNSLKREEIFELVSSLENSGLSTNEKIANRIKDFFAKPNLENFNQYRLAFFTEVNKPRKIPGKLADQVIRIADQQRYLIENFDEELNSFLLAKDSFLLIKFAQAVLANYSRLKNKHALLDYNDLIIESNKLLTNPDFSEWVKMKMDGSFDHVLIDESQDTNRQQWSIIKALCDDFFSGLSLSNNQRSIFIVGDEKQSIFSFQGAEPDISSEIFNYFKDKFGEQFKKIELHDSYRSTPEILAAVDKIFLNPQRKSAITKASEFTGHRATIERKGLFNLWQREENIENLIEKIGDWVKEKNPQDVMILLRNRTNGLFDGLVKKLQQEQIPFTSTAKSSFSENLIIQDFLAAAKFALLPQDDLNLACLLKSPFFDFSEDDLLKICLKKNENQTSIYKALEGTVVREKLDQLITNAKKFDCFEFFYSLEYQDLSGLETINKFLTIVFNFCQNSSNNLQKFLEFVEKIDPQISLAQSGEESLRISTIHGAKGLQAKIVLLADSIYDLRKSPSVRERILWINDLPIWCAQKIFENQMVKEFREQKFKQIFDESMRLLYVAMTRAEDELHIAGFGNSTDQNCWYEIISKN